MTISPYSLITNNDNSNEFFIKLSAFTDNVLSAAESTIGIFVNKFMKYYEKSGKESLRSFEEYLLEYIMIGVLWRNYSSNAASSCSSNITLLNLLYQIRSKSKLLKPFIDKFRGITSYKFLRNKQNKYLDFNLKNYKKLLNWLGATGEFEEEIIRLRFWAEFFAICNINEIYRLLSATYRFSSDFFLQGKKFFSEYTSGVDSFRINKDKKYRYREDYFFIQKSEMEYFLSFLGVEILNRQVRPEFKKTKFKVVLLPTCMKNTSETQCKARWDGKGMICIKCSESCNIGNVARQIAEKSIKIYLISHFSDFICFIKNWADQREVALVGAACVLNLLPAGLKMKRLNMLSQCVFLDYCGCKKHWNDNENPTSLNINQLKKTIFSCHIYK